MTGGSCYGSVLLDSDLRRSLAATNGRDVSWVHGCVLDHGHDDDHGAPIFPQDGQPQQWLRWSDRGPARIEQIAPSPPGRHSRPPTSARTAPTPPPAADTTAPGPGEVERLTAGSQIDALWAIAAAIDRLADAVADWGNPHRDNRTR